MRFCKSTKLDNEILNILDGYNNPSNSECEYPVYYSEEENSSITYYVAYSDDNTPTAIISYMSDTDNLLLELTAYTIPSFRNKKIFTTLYEYSIEDILNTLPNYKIYCSIPDALMNTSFTANHIAKEAMKEYLLRLDKRSFEQNKDNIIKHLKTKTAYQISDEFEEFYTEENEFLVYKNNTAEEPSAVLSYETYDNYTCVYGVFVNEASRNQGLGLYTMLSFISDYFQDNATPIILNVKSVNSSACKLYDNLGFIKVSYASFPLLH